MQKLFRSGDIFFGLLMLLWRGPGVLTRKLWTAVCRRAVAYCGANTIFAGGVYIDRPKQVEIGTSCYIGPDVVIGAELANGHLVIADNVQISEGCHIDYSGNVCIGEGVLISPQVRILSHDHGYGPRSRPKPFPLEIESGAWIGMSALILPGTERIGQRAIVGAGAVVSRPVPDRAIVVGNPARVIKYRQHDLSD